MNKELLLVIEAVSNERDVEKEAIFEAMEAALAQAAKKTNSLDWDVRVTIDRQSGDYETFRRWTVVADDELENEEAQYTLTQAKKIDNTLAIDSIVEEEIESVKVARVSAQAAKQVIVQKVREAERERMAQRYQKQVGKLVHGAVTRVTRDVIIVDLGDGAEGIMPREELLPREALRIGDRVRTILKEIRRDHRGATLILSRICDEMLTELFKVEVPEIQEQVIEIMGAARDPGSRAKIAVKTNDGRIDPIGACVGMRGSRVQNISNDLGGERIDIILWDDNPAQLTINAMSPAEVVSLVLDEDSATMDIAVTEEQLPQAIGKNGQNVRLASKLTGWRLNVMSETQAKDKQQNEATDQLDQFINLLEVNKDVAVALVEAGFTNIDEVAYVPHEELLEIEGFDAEIVNDLRERAKNKLLALALTGDTCGPKMPSEELLAMEGMSRIIAHRLAEADITTVEILAEQSVDELLEIEGISRSKAEELIIKAREPWFSKESE